MTCDIVRIEQSSKRLFTSEILLSTFILYIYPTTHARTHARRHSVFLSRAQTQIHTYIPAHPGARLAETDTLNHKTTDDIDFTTVSGCLKPN